MILVFFQWFGRIDFLWSPWFQNSPSQPPASSASSAAADPWWNLIFFLPVLHATLFTIYLTVLLRFWVPYSPRALGQKTHQPGKKMGKADFHIFCSLMCPEWFPVKSPKIPAMRNFWELKNQDGRRFIDLKPWKPYSNKYGHVIYGFKGFLVWKTRFWYYFLVLTSFASGRNPIWPTFR